jgi:hypothetical protein
MTTRFGGNLALNTNPGFIGPAPLVPGVPSHLLNRQPSGLTWLRVS